MNTPTAGWYRDPTGRHEHRYWDGADWTEHVANQGVQDVEFLDAVFTIRSEAIPDDAPAGPERGTAAVGGLWYQPGSQAARSSAPIVPPTSVAGPAAGGLWYQQESPTVPTFTRSVPPTSIPGAGRLPAPSPTDIASATSSPRVPSRTPSSESGGRARPPGQPAGLTATTVYTRIVGLPKWLLVLTIGGVALILVLGAVMLSSAVRDATKSNTAKYIENRGAESDFAECIVDRIKEEVGLADFDSGVSPGPGTDATVDGFVQIFYTSCKSHTHMTRNQMLDRFSGGL